MNLFGGKGILPPGQENTPRAFAVARQIVASTRAGKAGLVKVVYEKGEIQFYSSVTNKSYPDLTEALNRTREFTGGRYSTALEIFSATDSQSTNLGSLGKTISSFGTDRSGSGRQVFRDMLSRLEEIQTEGGSRYQTLKAAGINVEEFLKSGQMFQSTYSIEADTVYNSMDQFKKATRDDKKEKIAEADKTLRELLTDPNAIQTDEGARLGSGITFLDSKKSVKVIGFRFSEAVTGGNTTLTSYQAHLLAAVVGNPFFNPEAFRGIVGDTGGTSLIAAGKAANKFSDKSLKIAKRQRAILGERPISLAGEDLFQFLSNAVDEGLITGQKKHFVTKTNAKLSNHVLITDFEYDVMLNFAYKDNADEIALKTARTEQEKILYRNAKSGNYVQGVMDFFQGKSSGTTRASRMVEAQHQMSSDDFETLRRLMRDAVEQNGPNGRLTAFNAGTSEFGSDVLKERLKQSFLKEFGGDSAKVDKFMYVTDALMKVPELSKDGADLANVKFFQAQVNFIKKQIADVMPMLEDPALSIEDKLVLQDSIKKLERTQRNFQNAIDHGGQVTGRISVFGVGTAKDIVSVSEFESGLDDIAFILNKTSVKLEAGFAGIGENLTEFINLSGMTSGFQDNVKVDYSAVAAHGSFFGSEQQIQGAIQRAEVLQAELTDAIENNYFSPRIREILDKAASSSADEIFDDANDFSVMAATKAREQAKVMQEYLSRGGRVADNTEILNSLFDIVAREAYRYEYDKAEVKMIMANVYRFGIDSEAGLLGRSKYKGSGNYRQYQASEIFLGGKNGLAFGGDKFTIQVGDESLEVAEEVIKFRIADHKVLFSEDMVAKYIDSLGGFDLDDKGLPAITRFKTANGVEKLAFDMLRQPTGPEESLFLLPNFDALTVKHLLDRDEMQHALFNLQTEFSDMASARGVFANVLQDMTDRNLAGVTGLGVDDVMSRFQESAEMLSEIFETGGLKGFYSVNFEKDADLARRVEDAMLDLLRYSEIKEFTTVNDISARRAKRIQMYGSSSLFNAPGKSDASYTSEGIYKIMDQSGVFEFEEDMLLALKQAGYDQTFIDGFKAAKGTTFDSQMGFLADNITGPQAEEKLMALYGTAFGIQGAKAVSGAVEAQLGTYINTSMVVSSMLDQYEDFVSDLSKLFPQIVGQDSDDFSNFNKIYKALTDYNVGLISQELAIDVDINQGVARAVDQQRTLATAILQAKEGEFKEFTNQKALKETIEKLGGADLETLNKYLPTAVIGQTGFAQAVSESMGLGYGALGGYGFDERIFSSRLMIGNQQAAEYLEAFVAGKRAGYKLMSQLGLGSVMSQSQADMLARMDTLISDVKNAGDKTAAKEAANRAAEFMRSSESGIFLSAESERYKEYAGVARFSKAGAAVAASFTTQRRSASATARTLQQRALDSALSAAKEESLNRVQVIADEYLPKIKAMKAAGKRIEDLADLDIEEATIKNMKIIEDLYREIGKSAQLENVSQYELLLGLDRAFSAEKISLDKLSVLPALEGQQSSELVASMNRARRLLSINQSINKDVMGIGEGLFNKMSTLTEGIDGATFAERLTTFMDQYNSSSIQVDELNDTEIRMINRLINDGRDAKELEKFRLLQRNALASAEVDDDTRALGILARQYFDEEDRIYGAFAAHSQYNDNLVDFKELTRYGTAQTQADLADEMGEALDDFAGRDPDRFTTQYKRIMDKIAEQDFIDFIKRPAVKKTMYGMAGFIAFSFLYQSNKDRSQSDMAGPPLLPGGSAYETRISPGDSNLEDIRYQGYNPGVSYQVSLHGDQNSINNFRQSVGDLNYGNLTTTMYNNLPRLGRDLYADVAPDF